MKVVEIFRSIEGEGIRAGLPATFIRLYGCNLQCTYCDSQYACNGGTQGVDFYVMSIPEIMESVKSYKLKRVTLTGGEPMIHPGVKKLLDTLVKEGYEVNVETNGTQFPYRYKEEPVYESIDFRTCKFEPVYAQNHGRIFYTMDWKCLSSGMEGKMNIDLVDALENTDVLKFVVGSVEDMNGALSVIERMTSKPTIFFSPVFGKIEPSEIVDYLLNKGLYNCRVQIQMHKVIWDPDKRGV